MSSLSPRRGGRMDKGSVDMQPVLVENTFTPGLEYSAQWGSICDLNECGVPGESCCRSAVIFWPGFER